MIKKIKPLKLLFLFVLVIFLFVLTKEVIRRHYVKVIELKDDHTAINTANLLNDNKILITGNAN